MGGGGGGEAVTLSPHGGGGGHGPEVTLTGPMQIASAHRAVRASPTTRAAVAVPLRDAAAPPARVRHHRRADGRRQRVCQPVARRRHGDGARRRRDGRRGRAAGARGSALREDSRVWLFARGRVRRDEGSTELDGESVGADAGAAWRRGRRRRLGAVAARLAAELAHQPLSSVPLAHPPSAASLAHNPATDGSSADDSVSAQGPRRRRRRWRRRRQLRARRREGREVDALEVFSGHVVNRAAEWIASL